MTFFLPSALIKMSYFTVQISVQELYSHQTWNIKVKLDRECEVIDLTDFPFLEYNKDSHTILLPQCYCPHSLRIQMGLFWSLYRKKYDQGLMMQETSRSSSLQMTNQRLVSSHFNTYRYPIMCNKVKQLKHFPFHQRDNSTN